MADATEAEDAPPHRSLPDAIVVWEILVRLPSKSLLRCRCVCRAWRRATSTGDFLLAHHARQPTLPLLYRCQKSSVDILSFDHRAAADDHIQPVATLDHAAFYLMASCDGLLVISDPDGQFTVCNPATREYAPLRQLDEFTEDDDDDVDLTLVGMYPHGPTGEYRLLGKLEADDLDGYHYAVFTLGSSQPPRPIECPYECEHGVPVLFNDSLHWCACDMILVFDITTETFRKMRQPIAPSDNVLMFESGGKLGISRFNDEETIVDIWMMEDYGAEVWVRKHTVELPVAELELQFGEYQQEGIVVIPSCNGEVSGLVKFGECLLQIDINGKVVASFDHHKLLVFSPLWLKQTLVQHSFFPTLEGYVVNGSPFKISE
ncbi:unnamed protein product [Alopecurus aequalis]